MLAALGGYQPSATNSATGKPPGVLVCSGHRATIACWEQGFRSARSPSGRLRPFSWGRGRGCRWGQLPTRSGHLGCL